MPSPGPRRRLHLRYVNNSPLRPERRVVLSLLLPFHADQGCQGKAPAPLCPWNNSSLFSWLGGAESPLHTGSEDGSGAGVWESLGKGCSPLESRASKERHADLRPWSSVKEIEVVSGNTHRSPCSWGVMTLCHRLPGLRGAEQRIAQITWPRFSPGIWEYGPDWMQQSVRNPC